MRIRKTLGARIRTRWTPTSCRRVAEVWHVAPSRIQGLGVFMRVPLRQGSMIGLAYWKDGSRWQWTPLGRFHNHSTQPNAININVNNRRYLYAARDLFPGDEITVDYRLQPDLEQPQGGWR